MELRELVTKTMSIFEVDCPEKLSSQFMNIVMGNSTNQYDNFIELVNTLDVDWLQKIFQYYYADRKIKCQDYTPKCLAQFVSYLAKSENETTVYDMCAGSGALTIQKWSTNHNLQFVCDEFDERVIPFLLFNLAIRNINAIVRHCDVLSGEVFKCYKVVSGEKYSEVVEISTDFIVKTDTCISNPPYNIKWEQPCLAQLQPRFAKSNLPPANNANFAFVLTALENAEKSALILPNGVLNPNNASETAITKYLVDNNLIESIIINADKMFEATAIGTCILVLNKNKLTTKTLFVDMRQCFKEEVREQNGQFGGKSHTNRTYTKTVKIYEDEEMKKVAKCSATCKNIEKNMCLVMTEKIKQNKYVLNPSKYIDYVEEENIHRNYTDIVKDLNHIRKRKNACKLTINETLARQIGLAVNVLKTDINSDADECTQFVEKLSGIKVIKNNYIAFSKNKGEIKFENGSKDMLSEILIMLLQSWKQNVIIMNNEENMYLSELRDALLPDLMSGKIEI